MLESYLLDPSRTAAELQTFAGLFPNANYMVISGATGSPLETELNLVTRIAGVDKNVEPMGFSGWLLKVRDALIVTNAKYPFIAYGTDWLAFAHFIIAIAFIGPWRDPVRNAWVIDFGMIACALVVPFALLMGRIREIPYGWQLIDCSFGVLGIIPLWFCRRQIQNLTRITAATTPSSTQP